MKQDIPVKYGDYLTPEDIFKRWRNIKAEEFERIISGGPERAPILQPYEKRYSKSLKSLCLHPLGNMAFKIAGNPRNFFKVYGIADNHVYFNNLPIKSSKNIRPATVKEMYFLYEDVVRIEGENPCYLASASHSNIQQRTERTDDGGSFTAYENNGEFVTPQDILTRWTNIGMDEFKRLINRADGEDCAKLSPYVPCRPLSPNPSRLLRRADSIGLTIRGDIRNAYAIFGSDNGLYYKYTPNVDPCLEPANIRNLFFLRDDADRIEREHPEYITGQPLPPKTESEPADKQKAASPAGFLSLVDVLNRFRKIEFEEMARIISSDGEREPILMPYAQWTTISSEPLMLPVKGVKFIFKTRNIKGEPFYQLIGDDGNIYFSSNSYINNVMNMYFNPNDVARIEREHPEYVTGQPLPPSGAELANTGRQPETASKPEGEPKEADADFLSLDHILANWQKFPPEELERIISAHSGQNPILQPYALWPPTSAKPREIRPVKGVKFTFKKDSAGDNDFLLKLSGDDGNVYFSANSEKTLVSTICFSSDDIARLEEEHPEYIAGQHLPPNGAEPANACRHPETASETASKQSAKPAEPDEKPEETDDGEQPAENSEPESSDSKELVQSKAKRNRQNDTDTTELQQLTVNDVCRILRIGKSTLYRWMKQGKFPKGKIIGKKREWHYTAIQQFIKDKEDAEEAGKK